MNKAVLTVLIKIMRETLANYGRGEPCFYSYAAAIARSKEISIEIVQAGAEPAPSGKTDSENTK